MAIFYVCTIYDEYDPVTGLFNMTQDCIEWNEDILGPWSGGPGTTFSTQAECYANSVCVNKNTTSNHNNLCGLYINNVSLIDRTNNKLTIQLETPDIYYDTYIEYSIDNGLTFNKVNSNNMIVNQTNTFNIDLVSNNSSNGGGCWEIDETAWLAYGLPSFSTVIDADPSLNTTAFLDAYSHYTVGYPAVNGKVLVCFNDPSYPITLSEYNSFTQIWIDNANIYCQVYYPGDNECPLIPTPKGWSTNVSGSQGSGSGSEICEILFRLVKPCFGSDSGSQSGFDSICVVPLQGSLLTNYYYFNIYTMPWFNDASLAYDYAEYYRLNVLNGSPPTNNNDLLFAVRFYSPGNLNQDPFGIPVSQCPFVTEVISFYCISDDGQSVVPISSCVDGFGFFDNTRKVQRDVFTTGKWAILCNPPTTGTCCWTIPSSYDVDPGLPIPNLVDLDLVNANNGVNITVTTTPSATTYCITNIYESEAERIQNILDNHGLITSSGIYPFPQRVCISNQDPW